MEQTKELEAAFPEVEPGAVPLGARVLVQLRTTKQTSSGGIILASDTKETEKWNTQVGRVIRIGDIAFRNRETGARWPEGTWATPGDYVRVPRWGGDRWAVKVEGQEEPALFVIFNDHELIARITGNPLEVKAFIL